VLVTRLGDDAAGTRIRRVLDRFGVDASLVEVDPALPTGTVTVEISDRGHAFVVHRPAAWDAIAGPTCLPRHEAFYFGTLAARADRSRSTLRRLLAGTAAPLRVFDVNLRPPDVDREVLELGLARATLLKANDEELDAVAELLALAATPKSFLDAAADLRWLCVTRGDEGAALHARSGASWEIAGVGVDVVDTVGAGDAFTAGLIDSLSRGSVGAEALEAARRAAASVLVRRGGLPDP
jgi:fructokinase